MAATLRYPVADGTQVIDLVALADADLVAAQLASQLRLSAPGTKSLDVVTAHLRSRRMLIVLDNCEHVVDAVSVLAEAILQGAPNVHILATSREPLRALAEWVQRLGPLAVPPSAATPTAAEVRRYPAVRLLEERAAACDGRSTITDEAAGAAAEICTRLDGLPLAIELAATRVVLFGFNGLAERLDDRFGILTKGRRTAVPRHQTLAAMVDWSYETLSEEQRIVWRRLSVFRASFTIEAADAIGNNRPAESLNIVDILDGLVEKSLVAIDSRAPDPVTVCSRPCGGELQFHPVKQLCQQSGRHRCKRTANPL